MGRTAQCSRCGHRLTLDQVYAYQSKVFCEDCLMKVGLAKSICDPWRLSKETETDYIVRFGAENPRVEDTPGEGPSQESLD